MPSINRLNLTPRPQLAITEQGLISETFHRGSLPNATILTAQRIQGGLLGLRAGDVVTNLHCILATSGSGAGYARMALYSSGGTQLGVTGDANAAFTGATGLLTIALASPYTILTGGGFYVCVLSDLVTTQPTLRWGSNSGGGATAAGSGKAVGVLQSAQASFPTSSTFTDSNLLYWFGVS